MGLKYDSGESRQMIARLQEAITSVLNFTQLADSGINQLVASVGKDGMTGKAYESGKNLFSGHIKSEVQKLKSATDKLKSDLARYKSADQRVSHYGHIDEDQLENTKSQIQKQIRNLQSMQQDYQRKSSKAHDSDLSMIYRSHASHLQWQIEGQHEGLHVIEKELADLRSYNHQVSGLFKAALKETIHVQTSINNAGTKTSDSLMKELKSLLKNTKNFTSQDTFIRIQQLLKLYPKRIVKKVIASDEFWTAAKTYLKPASRIKLIQGLIKYEKFGNQTFLKNISINKIGSSVKYMNYVLSPLESLTEKGLKMIPSVKGIIGKGGDIAVWASLGITFASSAVSEFQKTKSIGKATIGGGIKTVKSVGPFEGAAIGATIGGTTGGVTVPIVGAVPGAVVGGIVGAGLGIFNFGINIIAPKFYPSVKKVAYNLYDNGKKMSMYEIDNKNWDVNKSFISKSFNIE